MAPIVGGGARHNFCRINHGFAASGKPTAGRRQIGRAVLHVRRRRLAQVQFRSETTAARESLENPARLLLQDLLSENA